MNDEFKIFVEQLREGQEQTIQEHLSPDFLDVHEAELVFDQPIELTGKTYLAQNELIIYWNIYTQAKIPCAICNNMIAISIDIKNFYASEPLESIKTGIYNFKNLLRETILLEVPSFTECHNGNCPKRKEFNKYLKKTTDQTVDEEEGYRPFADLDWKP